MADVQNLRLQKMEAKKRLGCAMRRFMMGMLSEDLLD
jgi:hypothetical protein